MDLKSEGRTWVGNIYHKIETIYQVVDDFVNKDNVKYVDNQGMMHNIHPCSEDNGQTKVHAGASMQNDVVDASFKSVVTFKEKHWHVSEKKDLNDSDPNELNHLGQSSPPPSADSALEAAKDSRLKETSDPVSCSNTELVFEENMIWEEHPASEPESSLEDKNSWELLWTQEPHPVCLQDKNSSLRSSADEDHEIANLEKYSPEALVPSSVHRVVPGKQVDADGKAESADKEVINLPLQHDDYAGFVKCGMGLEVNVRKGHLVVDDRSYPIYESSSNVLLHQREKHPDAENSNLPQDRSLLNSLLISTNEDYWSTIPSKSSPEISVDDEKLRHPQQEDGVCKRPDCSDETETNLSLDCHCPCMPSDFGFVENCLVEGYASSEYLRFPEHRSSCQSYLCPRKLLVKTDDLSSLNKEYSSELSLINRNTIPSKMSPVNSVNGVGLNVSKKDETESNNPFWEEKLSEAEASISSVSIELLDLPDLSHGNSTQKTEELCCDFTESLSRSSSSLLSSFTSNDKDVNLTAASSRTASSADPFSTDNSMLDSFRNKLQQSFEGITYDSISDYSDAEMETVDLSDKAKIEESGIILDSELLYAASSRPRKYRSYKKLIQEAFASRKRLIKEYEQLSIWYGDIDKDTNFHSDQCLPPQIPSTSRPSTARDLGESEWELL